MSEAQSDGIWELLKVCTDGVAKTKAGDMVTGMSPRRGRLHSGVVAWEGSVAELCPWCI